MAVQMGLVPVSIDAMEGALRLNGVAVDDNLKAFAWGRWLAHDPDVVLKASGVIATTSEIDDNQRLKPWLVLWNVWRSITTKLCRSVS